MDRIAISISRVSMLTRDKNAILVGQLGSRPRLVTDRADVVFTHPQPHLSNFTTGRGAPAIDFGKKLEKY